MAIDARVGAHHRILELAGARGEVRQMLFAHLAVGIGGGGDPRIMARDPAARRPVARFAADPILDRGAARRPRRAVAAEAHRRLCRNSDAGLAPDELAAAALKPRPGAAVRAPRGQRLMPFYHVALP